MDQKERIWKRWRYYKLVSKLERISVVLVDEGAIKDDANYYQDIIILSFAGSFDTR